MQGLAEISQTYCIFTCSRVFVSCSLLWGALSCPRSHAHQPCSKHVMNSLTQACLQALLPAHGMIAATHEKGSIGLVLTALDQTGSQASTMRCPTLRALHVSHTP